MSSHFLFAVLPEVVYLSAEVKDLLLLEIVQLVTIVRQGFLRSERELWDLLHGLSGHLVLPWAPRGRHLRFGEEHPAELRRGLLRVRAALLLRLRSSGSGLGLLDVDGCDDAHRGLLQGLSLGELFFGHCLGLLLQIVPGSISFELVNHQVVDLRLLCLHLVLEQVDFAGRRYRLFGGQALLVGK